MTKDSKKNSKQKLGEEPHLEEDGSDDLLSQTLQPSDEGPVRSGKQAKFLFGLILALALLSLFIPRGDGTSTAPGGFLLDATGRPTTLGDHLTPVVLLHFWATWCPPCIQEIPALERLARDFSGKPGFQVVMVAVDDELQKVQPFVGERAFAVLYDPEWQVAHRYGTRKLPETHVLVNNRKIDRLRFVGATNWDNPEIRATLDQIIQRVADGDELEAIIEDVQLDRSLLDNTAG
ncbi:MAG: TlpA disulfide reductase family protein [Acidobacteriota bacterium]|nr:TlpA disulfide reductase family protein [Acidobacteriota bacterium]